MTRGMRRTVAAPAMLALLLQGVFGGVLACTQISAGAFAEGHASHSVGALQATTGQSHTVVRVTPDGNAMANHMTSEQRDDAEHQDACMMVGHCSVSLTTDAPFTLAALPNRAHSPGFLAWVLHGAPHFGLTPPPKA